MCCFGLGGNLNADQLSDYLRGECDVSDVDHNVLVHALNEFFADRGDNHITYRPVSLFHLDPVAVAPWTVADYSIAWSE